MARSPKGKRSAKVNADHRFRHGTLAALAVVLGALYFARPSPKAAAETRGEEPPAPPPIAQPAEPLLHEPVYTLPSPAKEPVREATPDERRAFNVRKADMTARALDDIRTWQKYPLWSSPLTENMQYKPPTPFHTSSGGPGDSFPKMEIYPEKLNYGLREPIRIVAVAWGPGGKIHFDAITGTTEGAMRPRPKMDLEFVEQSDQTYVATIPMTDDVARKNRGDWPVVLNCEIEGQHRVGTTQFNLMATDATVTGPYRVAQEDGSLSVYVGINASIPSRQHLKGELWGAHDEPVAYAWVRNDDTPAGASTMKLVFYGKTIRDSGVDGPYTVKNLVLTTFDATNDRIENPAVDPQLTTPAFKHDTFTDVAINANDPTLADRQRILEDELDKAKSNKFDPNHMTAPLEPKVRKDLPPPQ